MYTLAVTERLVMWPAKERATRLRLLHVLCCLACSASTEQALHVARRPGVITLPLRRARRVPAPAERARERAPAPGGALRAGARDVPFNPSVGLQPEGGLQWLCAWRTSPCSCACPALTGVC
jgi:hypothetical protein